MHTIISTKGQPIQVVFPHLIWEAMEIVYSERTHFVATEKTGDGSKPDFVTSADIKAQEYLQRQVQELFPGCGLIGEEDALSIPSQNGYYITVDPVDGTKRFIAGDFDKVSCMVSLVHEATQEVVASYIGIFDTREIYGFHPGAEQGYCITSGEEERPLIWTPAPHGILLHGRLNEYESRTVAFATSSRFVAYETIGGSIGAWCTRLWRRDYRAALLHANKETPWDVAPVVGLCRKLGYLFFRHEGATWVEYSPPICKETYERTHDLLIVHSRDVAMVISQ